MVRQLSENEGEIAERCRERERVMRRGGRWVGVTLACSRMRRCSCRDQEVSQSSHNTSPLTSLEESDVSAVEVGKSRCCFWWKSPHRLIIVHQSWSHFISAGVTVTFKIYLHSSRNSCYVDIRGAAAFLRIIQMKKQVEAEK